MRIFKRIRGPRLGTKIMLLGLTLLIVPWFSYRQLVEMEQLLIQGQGRTQLLTAEGISTLFNGREDLFDDPRSVVRVGQIVRVKVLEVDRERGRVSLSIKALGQA